jgi:alpha-beta hydrolase superfamily lysophospholipase
MTEIQTAYLPDPHPHQDKDYFKSVKVVQSIFKTSTRKEPTSLYTQQLFPLDGKFDGIYVMHHGYAEHSSRYFEYATQVVNKLNVAVYLIDAYGHGRNENFNFLIFFKIPTVFLVSLIVFPTLLTI